MTFWLGTFVALLACAPVLAMVVTAGDEEQQAVQATVGETVVLRLPSAPGTGYTWRVVAIDKEHLSMLGEATFDAPATPALGASGHQVFRFLMQKPGPARVAFDYLRPWETDRKPIRHFTLEITVRP